MATSHMRHKADTCGPMETRGRRYGRWPLYLILRNCAFMSVCACVCSRAYIYRCGLKDLCIYVCV